MEKEPKDLSITIVVYRNYSDVKKALKTIENYTSKKIQKQIYIVDNGTRVSDLKDITDFKTFIEQYSDIEYIDLKDNIGFGKGHNYIIDKLDSKYHAIVNPDILLKEDSFSKILKYMDENNDVGMCIPKIIGMDGEILRVYREEVTIWDMFIRMFFKKALKKRFDKHTLQDKDYTKEFQVPFGQGSFLVIRTELFKELNGFDENYFMYMEDADLCKRVNYYSKLMYYPGTTVIHKWEKGSHKNKKLFMYHVKSMIYYFKKWKNEELK